MPGHPRYRAAAERLAADVRRGREDMRVWRRVTELLDDFGLDRLTPEVRAAMTAALQDAGLRSEPDLLAVARQDAVRLVAAEDGRPRDALRLPDTAYSRWPLDRALHVTWWRPGRPPEEAGLHEPPPSGAAVWIDVNVVHTQPAAVFEAVGRRCPGLTEAMVGGLFEGRPRAGVQDYGPAIRSVVAFGVRHREPEDAGDATRSKSGALVFQPVELVVGDGWVLSAFLEAEVHDGAGQALEPPGGYHATVDAVAALWTRREVNTAGDLAVAILRVLVASSRAGVRAVETWLETWELGFDVARADAERDTLMAVRRLLAELRRRLGPLDMPSPSGPARWFADVTDERSAAALDGEVARALADVRDVGDGLRTSLDLVVAADSAAQVRLAEARAREEQDELNRQERFREELELFAAAFLIPGVLASILGIDSNLLRTGEWARWVQVAVVVAAVAAWLLSGVWLRRRWRRRRTELNDEVAPAPR